LKDDTDWARKRKISKAEGQTDSEGSKTKDDKQTVHANTTVLKVRPKPKLIKKARKLQPRRLPEPHHIKARKPFSNASYHLTTTCDIRNSKRLGPPVGPLIEYAAYKTGTSPCLILDYLIILDEELKSKARRRGVASRKLTPMTPKEAYEYVMNPRKKSKSWTNI